MAYPTVSAPYGFKPVNLAGGRVYSGSTRMFPISTGYSSNIFNGDLVGYANGALVAPSNSLYNGQTGATAGSGLGVFVGTEYSVSSSVGLGTSGPIYGKNRFQYWPASTNSQDAVGYIVDDEKAYFRVAVLQQAAVASASTFSIADITSNTIGYLSPAFLGTNVVPVSGAGGNTSSGDSSMGITAGNPLNGAYSSGNMRQTATSPFRVIQLVPDTAVSVSTTTASSISSGVVTVTSATGIQPGMQAIITGYTGALPGQFAVVTSVNGTSVTISSPSTTTGNVAGITCSAPSGTNITFVGYPEAIVGWNFGFQAYNIATGK
jgi:hypothetical protein